jgi:hypothetical protein
MQPKDRGSVTELASEKLKYAPRIFSEFEGVLKMMLGELTRTCVWRLDQGYDDFWEGSCGVGWVFTEGDVESNGVIYCPNCGGKVALLGEGDG